MPWNLVWRAEEPPSPSLPLSKEQLKADFARLAEADREELLEAARFMVAFNRFEATYQRCAHTAAYFKDIRAIISHLPDEALQELLEEVRRIAGYA